MLMETSHTSLNYFADSFPTMHVSFYIPNGARYLFVDMSRKRERVNEWIYNTVTDVNERIDVYVFGVANNTHHETEGDKPDEEELHPDFRGCVDLRVHVIIRYQCVSEDNYMNIIKNLDR